ncbi:MAG: hypothetical protein ACXVH3_38095 [Solirubrobacteraceae bacterium]
MVVLLTKQRNVQGAPVGSEDQPARVKLAIRVGRADELLKVEIAKEPARQYVIVLDGTDIARAEIGDV